MSNPLPLAVLRQIRFAVRVPVDPEAIAARAREAWGFDVDREQLAAWLTAPGYGHDVGLALACALFHGSREAHAAFERVVAPRVRAALRKLGADDAEAEEHLQLARTRLLVDGQAARLRTYRGNGSFEAFVTTVAVRSFADAHRKPASQGADALDRLPAAVDLERALARSGQQAHFASAFRAALAELSPRERALLHLNLVEGASIDELAPMYQVSRATVARWVAAARQAVQRATLTRLQASARLAPSDLDSLLASIESGFDVSLRRFVREAAEEVEGP